MEITHIGHDSFKIKGKNLSLVIDPYNPKIGYSFPKQSAQILLLTNPKGEFSYPQGVIDHKLVVRTPGEYEISNVFIYGVRVHPKNDNTAVNGRRDTIYLIEIDGVSILHLGALGYEPSKETLEKISSVDVLMIPVGGGKSLDAEAASKVISSLEPGLVIPMHYKTPDLTGISDLSGVDKFLEEMGAEQSVRKEDKLKIGSRSDIPEDDTQVVILKQHH
jgi:L-ascorbate metabolism protein UlaG (beta-lactamase superfamily)